MSELQYNLIVTNGKTTQETGVFFPAIPFQIISDSTVVDVNFIHTDKHEVVYELTENGKSIIRLEHPNYTPDCSPEEVNETLTLSNNKGLTAVAAFLSLGIGKGQQFKSLLESGHSESFEVKQPFAL